MTREEAIDVLKHNCPSSCFEDLCKAVDIAIQALSAQPEQKWIPVTERLPDEGEPVLTQAMFKDDMKMCVSSRVDWNYWTGWGTRDINIIAWMPLPPIYRGE